MQVFLSSIRRNSIITAKGYRTSLVYFHEFLSLRHNHTLESILQAFSAEEKNGSIDVYEVLEAFIAFMQTEKKVSAASINQYLNGIRSFLAYYDVYIIPAKFKRRVKVPKVYSEEEQPLDIKDIRQILLNCHNRRLKAYLLALASAGTRAVETCAIRLRDIDFSTRPTKIHIRKEYAKTRVGRDIYISDEATKYLKDWIFFKYRIPCNSNDENDGSAVIDRDRDNNNQEVLYRIIRKKSDSLVFQGQINNSHITPQSIYIKLVTGFQQLLELAGFSDRKEGMRRHKITLHSFRRFVKTTISDCAGKEYSEWFLGHAKSSYYVNKPEVRADTYAEKCMKYLTFLDYTILEATGKNIEARVSEKEKEIQLLRQRDSVNTDAIANLSDQVMKLMAEVNEMKRQN